MDNRNKIKQRILELKRESGTHSPSIETILHEIPEINIKVDACFLSNPYATDLFMKYFTNDLIKTEKLRNVLEYYPPQNYDIRRHIAKTINAKEENIFVGNGAIEIIQAILHRFVGAKICVIIPTFSSYYEFARPDTEVIFYKLSKEDNFNINPENLIEFVKKNKPDSLVIINPNNPNGGYLALNDLKRIIESLTELDNIIIDESFIHFAYESVELTQLSSENLVLKHPNVIVVKSLSKDFGIAGIRAGYALMTAERVTALLKNGYLWNISGIANYFFQIYSQDEFLKEYDIVRKKYIMNTLMFLSEMSTIPKIKVYPSKANFALIELTNGMSSFEFVMELLPEYGIYVRDCSDKIGLEGQFIRVASRTFEENISVISAFKHLTS